MGLRLFKGGEGVRSLSRLGNPDHESLNRWRVVLEFGCKLQTCRNSARVLEKIFEDESGMIRCTAGNYRYGRWSVGRPGYRIGVHCTNRIVKCLGLFINFLEHIVCEPALFYILDRPVYQFYRPGHTLFPVKNLDPRPVQGSNISVFQEHCPLGILDDGGHVRSREDLPITNADHQRTCVSCSNYPVFGTRYDQDGVGSFEPGHDRLYCR